MPGVGHGGAAGRPRCGGRRGLLVSSRDDGSGGGVAAGQGRAAALRSRRSGDRFWRRGRVLVQRVAEARAAGESGRSGGGAVKQGRKRGDPRGCR